MPKVKMARKSTNIDMTAMCDVAFLLLTFFMLATKFKKDDPVMVVTPSSISQITVPDTSIMMITIDPKGRVYFSIDRKKVGDRDVADARLGLIRDMNEYKKLGLSDQEMYQFQKGAAVGVPFSQLKQYLASPSAVQKQLDAQSPGIPVDTSAESPDNELAAWIRVARNNNPFLRILIKGDVNTKYPAVDKVINTLGDMKIFRFNLITNLEAVPPGTAAYEDAQKKNG